jgi:3-phosphoshikimate 1-carboxyvinyltransferase
MEVLTLSRSLARVTATVSIPGSKSYTNRALIMAALAEGTSTLKACSPSRDCAALITALRLLGITIETPSPDTIIVTGGRSLLKPYCGTIDIGPAGTTMRFLTALCAGIPGAKIVVRGSERMHRRPIKALVDTLRQAGAHIDYLGFDECPPLHIHPSAPLRGEALSLDGTTSSQFVSALLLASPLFKDGLDLSIIGRQISTSYIDMTIQGMRDFGVFAECGDYKTIRVMPEQHYIARTYHVEGDASGASYLWAMAAVSGGTVTVKNINPDSAQGDIGFVRLLARMGCTVTQSADSITVSGPDRLQAIEADMELMPDTAQTLAVVAAFAQGNTTIRGLQTLRIKETDRIAALHTELAKLGIVSSTGADYLIVQGGMPHGAQIATYEDHRMAMSFAVCAAAIDGISIEEPAVVEKSFPSFWDTLAELGIASRYDACDNL